MARASRSNIHTKKTSTFTWCHTCHHRIKKTHFCERQIWPQAAFSHEMHFYKWTTLFLYRSGSQNGSRREMGHSVPTWAMHGRRQNSMHGPSGLTQIEKKCPSLFSNWNFKLKLAWFKSMNFFIWRTDYLLSNHILQVQSVAVALYMLFSLEVNPSFFQKPFS